MDDENKQEKDVDDSYEDTNPTARNTDNDKVFNAQDPPPGFRRKPRLSTTPPRARAYSMPEAEGMDTTPCREQRKRRRQETPEEDGKNTKQAEKNCDKYGDLIQKVGKHMTTLEKLLKENPNTQKKIKETILTMKFTMSQVERMDIRRIVDELRAEIKEETIKELNALREDNRETKRESKESAIQTSPTSAKYRRKAESENEIKRKIEEYMEKEDREREGEDQRNKDTKEIVKLKWPHDIYKVTQEETRGMIKAHNENDIAIIFDPEAKGNNPLLKKIMEMQPHLEKVIKGKMTTEGRVIMIDNGNKIIDEEGNTENITRRIYLAAMNAKNT